jgi:hypothetical protein
MNCWEFMKCGRERGGSNAVEMGVCPAYPDHGRDCARVAGTLCNGRVQGTHAQKLGNCTRCNFYQSGHYRRTSSASILSSSPDDAFDL